MNESARLAQGTTELMADELERLAARLRNYAGEFSRGVISPIDNASEIVNEYTRRAGNIGARLGDVVRNAGDAAAENAKGA